MSDSNQSITRTALVDLTLRRVALCNEGANSRAYILLTKRKEKNDMPNLITFDEIIKAMNPDQAAVVNKHITDSLTAKDTVITDLQAKVSTLEKSKPAVTPPAEDDILKNAPPEILAMVTKMQTTINTLVADKAEELATVTYAKLKAIPVEEATLKSVIKSASPSTIAVLEKAAAALEAKVLSGAGTDSSDVFNSADSDACYNVLEKSAKALMATEGGITFEKAFLKACEADPITYKKYTKGAGK